jgi:hypothetical protein
MAQTNESGVNFVPPTNWSSPAGAQQNQLREQISAYAYPDFCATIDGSTDNTTCLTDALNATGLYFSTLELPSQPPCGSCTTSSQTNYMCTSLGTTWPNPAARIHIWKGATISCAFPPADATHIIQDDNQAPIVPWSSATFTSTVGPVEFPSTSPNVVTTSGTYTGTAAGTYCLEIQQTTPSYLVEWGFATAGNEQPVPAILPCTTNTGNPITAGTPIALGTNGVSATFSSTGSLAVGQTWFITVTPAGSNPGNPVSVAVPTTADALCSLGGDTSITGVVCVNSGDDTSAKPFQTSLPIPAGAWAPGRTFRVTAQFALWTSSSPPSVKHLILVAGMTPLAIAVGPIVPTASLANYGFSASWLVVASPTGGYYIAQPLYNGLPGATAATAANQSVQPVLTGVSGFRFGVTNSYTGTSGVAGNAIQLQSLVVERIS